jgi:hypothetical protein
MNRPTVSVVVPVADGGAAFAACLLAADNVLGADHDLWNVNTDRSYYEEQEIGQRRVS